MEGEPTSVAPSLPLTPLHSPNPCGQASMPPRTHHSCTPAPSCRRQPGALGKQTGPGRRQSLLWLKTFPREPIGFPCGTFHQALIFTLLAWGGFDLQGASFSNRQKKLCAIQALNVTGSAGAEARAGLGGAGGNLGWEVRPRPWHGTTLPHT